VGGAVPEAQPYRQVKFENALDFLDEVKVSAWLLLSASVADKTTQLVYANQPEVYNQFLDTMKEFKTKLIDTPGVILRVKELFKTRPNLVLGFNNFLPPGYKISLPELEGASPNDLRAQQEQAALLHQQQQQLQQQQQQQQQQQHHHQVLPPRLVVVPRLISQIVDGSPASRRWRRRFVGRRYFVVLCAHVGCVAGGGSEQQQPEFYHARNFVKKIKMRFSQQPSIYKAFLEILHLYHKGSHNIRDVYTQVAKLFQNHTDLLEEFTQFLPDTTGTAGCFGRAAVVWCCLLLTMFLL
jgi:paired amphipathic helix protein Sin3a